MKELSIEEKAKRYDEAIKKVNDYYEGKTKLYSNVDKTLDYLFPELKESEDERIRKELIEHIKANKEVGFVLFQKFSPDDVIAWLEKQGEQKPAWSKEDERMRNAAINACKYMIDNFENSTKQYEDAIAWLEKQDVSNKVSIWKHWKDGIAGNGDDKQIFLIKSHNTYSLSSCLSFECDYIELSELEKLMEKKDESKFEQCIQEGDEIVTNEDGTHFNISQLERVSKKVTDTKETAKKFLKTAGIMDKNGELADEYRPEKQGGNSVTITKCNNSITNAEVVSHPTVTASTTIEPKFKVGDWVVQKYLGKYLGTYKIIEVCESWYEVISYNDGIQYSIGFDKEDDCHLWTIQDAKDGDVLAAEDKDKVFLYNGKLDLRGRVCAYCGIYKTHDGLRFTECAIGNYFTYKEPHPATKEQRDLLFQKMKEAGYEWDANKNEPKKIEQTSAWSEEDEIGLGDALWAIKQARTIAKDENDMGNLWYAERWLKLLKDRVQPQKEWSEEDEEMFKQALKYLKQSYYSEESVISWFNSLKDRVQPQNNTITSDELAQAKKEAYNDALDKIEYYSGVPSFDDGWSAAIWYIKKKNIGFKNTWKPSEEHIRYLQAVVNDVHNIGSESCCIALRNLLEQLKKL